MITGTARRRRTDTARIVCACVVACQLVFAWPRPPQETRVEQQRRRVPTYEVESNLVVVDVTVRDRQGNLVDNLGKEDFTVYEDNVRQEIMTFSLEKIPVAAPGNVADSAAKAGGPVPAPIDFSKADAAGPNKEVLSDKRLVILFFDLSSLDTEDLIRSVDAARDFVEKKSTEHDLLAVAVYNSTLELVQDLTNDREALLTTLAALSPTEAGDTPVEDLGDPDTSEEVFVPDAVQFNIFNTDRRLSALENLARMYREFPERKSLIYFSSGVTTTGVENDSQIRSTVDTANQSNMSIYTVDSRGLVALPPGGDASRGSPGGRAMFSGDAVRRQTANLSASQETLTTLAHDTGGAVFQDSNELGPVFDKVADDTRLYYVLGYYSTNRKTDGRFRKIRVDAKGPGLRIQHRPGYFAAKEFTRWTRTERDRQLEEALSVDRPFSAVPFILQADYFRKDDGITLVPLSIQLAGDGIEFEEKGDRREAKFEFLAQVVDPKGRVAGVARDAVDVRLPVTRAERIRTGQILYNTGFQLRPGEYRLKFLIRDNRTGKLGTFEQPLTVPALAAKVLETSSIVLGNRLVSTGEDAKGVEHTGFRPGFRMQQESARQDPLTIEDKRIVPSIGNVFMSRQTLYVYFQVYGAAADASTHGPSLQASLMVLQGNSKVLESRPLEVDRWLKGNEGVAAVAMALPLRTLRKGEYTVQIHLHDGNSDTHLFRRVPLVIE